MIVKRYPCILPLGVNPPILRREYLTPMRKARLKAGLSQEALADRARLHRNYVSLIERDRNTPNMEMFFRICKALNVSPSKFIARVERFYR